ncbi:hypothetical protein BIY24_08510 [Halobacteriovorax marinus]|uniref:hypothetical protein n=1 Tax=Halobacteriovorax marinus TaxID=97084 RepID=UPI000BC33231|nr:hypothetical protein [Halobacteriovorax marinus]ATH07991.1 hypothetical protein BIY24_08510 [Halobacteriovorax marinus]
MKTMKKVITILTLTMTPLLAGDFPKQQKRVIKEETHQTQIQLDTENVRCSALGYGASELKISVPSLEWYAIFDHSNRDGRGPCVTAGRGFCDIFGGMDEEVSEVLISEEKPTEDISVTVTLTEVLHETNEKCFRSLEESVETNVRGIPFTHLRIKDIGELPKEKCKF